MELPYLLALHAINGMNGQLLRSILQAYHNDAKAAWLDGANWSKRVRMSAHEKDLMAAGQNKIDVEQYYQRFLATGAKVVCRDDADYPNMLREIYDPPYLLYYMGELPPQNFLSIAVIGSRRCTNYGRQVAENLAAGMAMNGFWVIAGMARGIDSAGHRGALLAKGKTVAVLGSGIDVIYPPENKDLYRAICENGCVMSEFPLGAEPLARHFPIRNRIISGLSMGVVVVEGADRSGASITVDYALSQGRDIFAVPGSIQNLQSRLPHRLIQKGEAKLVEKAQDVLEEFESTIQSRQKKVVPFVDRIVPKVQLTEEEEALLKLLITPLHFDELVQKTGLTASQLKSKLTVMEVKGYIKQLPGQNYVIGNIIL